MCVCSKLAPGCTQQNKRKQFLFKTLSHPGKSIHHHHLPSVHYLNSFFFLFNNTAKLKKHLKPQMSKSHKTRRKLQSLLVWTSTFTTQIQEPNRFAQVLVSGTRAQTLGVWGRVLDLWDCFLVKSSLEVLPTQSSQSKKMNFVISYKRNGSIT